jgi:hypothetical protein
MVADSSASGNWGSMKLYAYNVPSNSWSAVAATGTPPLLCPTSDTYTSPSSCVNAFPYDGHVPTMIHYDPGSGNLISIVRIGGGGFGNGGVGDGTCPGALGQADDCIRIYAIKLTD